MTRTPAAVTLLNSIAAELGTTDKNTCINVALAMLVKSGLAVDAIMGDGAYKALAGQVYHALRGEVLHTPAGWVPGP